jgi:hypothetical protein
MVEIDYIAHMLLQDICILTLVHDDELRAR